MPYDVHSAQLHRRWAKCISRVNATAALGAFASHAVVRTTSTENIRRFLRRNMQTGLQSENITQIRDLVLAAVLLEEKENSTTFVHESSVSYFTYSVDLRRMTDDCGLPHATVRRLRGLLRKLSEVHRWRSERPFFLLTSPASFFKALGGDSKCLLFLKFVRR
jgi:hypothetical protein